MSLISPFEAPVVRDTTMEDHLAKVFEFTDKHVARLSNIEDTIFASICTRDDSAFDPVSLDFGIFDEVDTINILLPDDRRAVPSDPEFDKVMMVLTALSEECNFLTASASSQFYAPLSLFGNLPGKEDEEAFDAGELEEMMGRALGLFRNLANFSDRVNAVILNAVHQLAALFGRSGKSAGPFVGANLLPLYKSLGNLLTALITIDAIIRTNPLIAVAWEKFKSMSDMVQHDPAQFGHEGVGDDVKRKVDKLILRLGRVVMTSSLFRACVEQNFEVDADGAPVSVSTNGGLLQELHERIESRIDLAWKMIGTDKELDEYTEVVGVFGLYNLLRVLTRTAAPSKDLFAKLWRIQEKLPVVVLYGKVFWTPDEFLVRCTPIRGLDLRKLSPKDVNVNRDGFLAKLTESLPARVHHLHGRVCSWLIKLEAVCSEVQSGRTAAPPIAEVCRARGDALFNGILLAHAVSRLFREVIAMHFLVEKPIARRTLSPLAQCISLVKVVEQSLLRYTVTFSHSLAPLLRDTSRELLPLFHNAKARFNAAKSSEAASVPTMRAAVNLAERLVLSTEAWDSNRLDILDLALRIGLRKGIVKDEQLQVIPRVQWALGVLSSWQEKLRSAANCGFLYSFRSILPALLQSIALSPEDSRRLPYLITAFCDPASVLVQVVHVDGTVKAFSLFEAYRTFVMRCIQHEVIRPLCRCVENDLRIHVHSLELEHMEAPGPKTPGAADARKLLHLLTLSPFQVLQRTVDIRAHVTAYLERTFYNLTTVALHDWKTYGFMASLAADKYGLILTDNHLPMGTLNQGLDVLQIMRNIHIFVARYNYNLNQQFFVEKRSDKGAKHLNSVSIRSISASIRQHGTGMMNTTVNSAYQFIVRKFHFFREFLFDDNIKSSLSAQFRDYESKRMAKDNRFPYDVALNFTHFVRRFGVTEDKLTCLDKFRLLITHIGNALGYVRMVRSAGMHHASLAVQFVPDVAKVPEFEASVKGEVKVGKDVVVGLDDWISGDGGPSSGDGGAGTDSGAPVSLSPEAVEAGRVLDAVLANLTGSFSSAADYFKLLVDTFRSLSERDVHLSNFHIIIPALCLSFCESYKNAKDTLQKSVKFRETYFTDDGFAIGVAFILSVLRQDKAFDSLHWFESVRFRNETELAKIEAEEKTLKSSRQDKERAENLAGDRKRVVLHQREMDNLMYALNGARIFFKEDDDGRTVKESGASAAAAGGAGEA